MQNVDDGVTFISVTEYCDLKPVIENSPRITGFSQSLDTTPVLSSRKSFLDYFWLDAAKFFTGPDSCCTLFHVSLEDESEENEGEQDKKHRDTDDNDKITLLAKTFHRRLHLKKLHKTPCQWEWYGKAAISFLCTQSLYVKIQSDLADPYLLIFIKGNYPRSAKPDYWK